MLSLSRITVFLVATMVVTGTAAQDDGTYTVLGVGAISCGQFLKHSKNRDDLMGDMAWVQGFLSASNALSNEKNSPPSSAGYRNHAGQTTDYEGLKAWVINYCTAHPIDPLEYAAAALRPELILRQR
jgi:hypothetical protein